MTNMATIVINEEKTSASIFDKVEFITPLCESKSGLYLSMISNTIDRTKYFNSILELLENNVELAIDIEAGVFEYSIVYQIINNIEPILISAIYNEKFQFLLQNIDENSSVQNKTLRKTLLTNSINGQVLAFMSPQDLHPDGWLTFIRKKELIEYKKSHMAATDMYKCSKCGERKCKVTQMQTRSADEPMTNFVVCLVCYNTFKC